MTAPSDETAARRLPVVDVARGAALLAMFGYHLTWDLAHFGYVDPQTPFSPEMRLVSHLIASAFLFIAGASLVLARRHTEGRASSSSPWGTTASPSGCWAWTPSRAPSTPSSRK